MKSDRSIRRCTCPFQICRAVAESASFGWINRPRAGVKSLDRRCADGCHGGYLLVSRHERAGEDGSGESAVFEPQPGTIRRPREAAAVHAWDRGARLAGLGPARGSRSARSPRTGARRAIGSRRGANGRTPPGRALNLQPRPGRGWFPIGRSARLRATFNRTAGVRHLFAALDLASGQLFSTGSATANAGRSSSRSASNCEPGSPPDGCTWSATTSHPTRRPRSPAGAPTTTSSWCSPPHGRGDDAGPPTIRLHDLRHTHATLLLKAGVPVKVVSERLGHANPMITLSTYAHVMPGMQRQAADTFAALLAPTNAATASVQER